MDDADITQAREEKQFLLDQIEKRNRDADREFLKPEANCYDCGDALTALRQEIRAARCYDCQVAIEKWKRHYGKKL